MTTIPIGQEPASGLGRFVFGDHGAGGGWIIPAGRQAGGQGFVGGDGLGFARPFIGNQLEKLFDPFGIVNGIAYGLERLPPAGDPPAHDYCDIKIQGAKKNQDKSDGENNGRRIGVKQIGGRWQGERIVIHMQIKSMHLTLAGPPDMNCHLSFRLPSYAGSVNTSPAGSIGMVLFLIRHSEYRT